MNEALIKKLKNEIVETGRLLWDKNLATGLNGNMSVRLEKEIVLMTAHGTCLGRLSERDILLLDLDGNLLEGGKVSTERLLHTEIYKNFSEAKAVVHTHTAYVNGFFSANTTLIPSTFETKIYLGEVKSVEQLTPSVTDASPVIAALKGNNVVVLRNHGTVAMGGNLFDCFLLIQGLEEAVKTDCVSRLYKTAVASPRQTSQSEVKSPSTDGKKYKLFSKEQINEIVNLVNHDAQLKELGQKTQMTMDLAVKLNETGEVYTFSFQNGSITKVGNDENAEFLISAPTNIWRAVFNREIDPFVATTQKKMNLRGDFAKISKWYAPCSRIFELWQKVPVE